MDSRFDVIRYMGIVLTRMRMPLAGADKSTSEKYKIMGVELKKTGSSLSTGGSGAGELGGNDSASVASPAGLGASGGLSAVDVRTIHILTHLLNAFK